MKLSHHTAAATAATATVIPLRHAVYRRSRVSHSRLTAVISRREYNTLRRNSDTHARTAACVLNAAPARFGVQFIYLNALNVITVVLSKARAIRMAGAVGAGRMQVIRSAPALLMLFCVWRPS